MLRLVAIIGFLCLAPTGPTQLELDDGACARADRAQQQLDALFASLVKGAKSDTALVARLMKSQQAWIAFRDAQVKALYGGDDVAVQYGSVWPMCSCDARREMIEARTTQVQRMLTRKEGDVCSWKRP
jgi:uncharacterized protein YecT (DUF1311 family)